MHGIDGFLIVNGRGRYEVAEQKDAHGSDHRPVVLKVKR